MERQHVEPALVPMSVDAYLHRVRPFLVSLCAPLVALGFWALALRSVEPNPFPLFLAVVVVSALYGGFACGVVATLLTGVGAWVFYVDPYHQFTSHALRASFQIDTYVLIAIALNWFLAIHRRGRQDFERQLLLSSVISRNLAEGVFALDDKGRVTFVNPTAERLLGWPESELRGEDLHAVLHGQNEERVGCPLEARGSVNTGQSHDDQFHRKDGTRLPVAYTVGPLDLKGEIVGSVVTFRDITDRKQALESLRASEERYRGLVETSPDSIWLADAYGFIVMANNQAAALFGFDSADAMRGVNTAELFVPEARLGAVQDRHKTLEAGSLMNLEYLCESRNGQRFPVEMSLSAVCDDQGKPNGVIAMAREISQRKRAEETLRASEARLAMQYAATTVLAQTATLTDAVTKLLETVCTTAGWDLGIFWSRDEKTQSLQFQTHWHHPRVNITAFRKACQSIAITPGSDLPGQVWAAREPAWVVELADAAMFHRQSAAAQDGLRSAFCFPVMIDGVVHSVMEFFSREPRAEQRDQVLAMTTISTLIGQFIERKQAEDALEYQALHDALTDLPNRVLFHDRVLQTILSSSRSRRPFALLLMDLDHFKEVNDTFGHHYGDLLLQEVSGRIRGVLRNSDTVARLGGDEFAVLLPNVDLVGATATANKILAAFEAQVILEGRPFDIGASIGIAMFPEHSEDANALLRLADVAMYVAKRSGIGYAVYETNLDHNSESKMALKSDLRHAIENNELLLHYQPKVNLKTGRISSVEALVRWMHPDHGLIQPDQFISLAEQMGLIQVLSLHVLSAALDQCRRWADAGIDMQVAVNFSTISLHDQQLVGMIAQMLRTCNVSAGRLQVEITESAVMQDPDLALTILTRLHEMGVHISIDDFGIGHSSLAYIKRLPVDEIKIDKAFVLDMAHNEDDAFIVRSVIELGHKLNLDVVAEGVETLEVMNLLTTLGCDMAQGTYLSEPIEAGELSRRFADEDAQLPHVG